MKKKFFQKTKRIVVWGGLSFLLLSSYSVCAQFSKVEPIRVFLNSRNVFYFNKAVLKPTYWLDLATRYNLHPKQLADFNFQKYRNNSKILSKEIGVPLFFSVNLLEKEIPISGVTYLPANYIVEKKTKFISFKRNFDSEIFERIKKLNHLADGDIVKKGEALFLGYFRINLQYGNSSFARGDSYKVPLSGQKSYQRNQNNLNNQRIMDDSPPVQTFGSQSYQKDQNNLVNQGVVEASPQPVPGVRATITPNSSVVFEKTVENVNSAFKPDFSSTSPNLKNKTCQFISYESLLPENGGKFFVLSDDCAVGKVIQIKNPKNGITIYAKIAKPLPSSMAGNNDVCVLISEKVRKILKIQEGEGLQITYEQKP